MVPMDKTLPCGHQTQLPCHVNSEKFKCLEKVCPNILSQYCQYYRLVNKIVDCIVTENNMVNYQYKHFTL